jgi:hypothetical protein
MIHRWASGRNISVSYSYHPSFDFWLGVVYVAIGELNKKTAEQFARQHKFY